MTKDDRKPASSRPMAYASRVRHERVHVRRLTKGTVPVCPPFGQRRLFADADVAPVAAIVATRQRAVGIVIVAEGHVLRERAGGGPRGVRQRVVIELERL